MVVDRRGWDERRKNSGRSDAPQQRQARADFSAGESAEQN
jgi:hypothetical protein